MSFERVAGADELLPGEARTVAVFGREYALFNVDGTFYCLDNECPHRDGPLGEGEVEGETVLCPWHAWEINIRTGEVLHATNTCVAKHACKVEDGSVWIDV